jgi:hypothetical protein
MSFYGILAPEACAVVHDHHHHVTNQAIASMPSTPRPSCSCAGCVIQRMHLHNIHIHGTWSSKSHEHSTQHDTQTHMHQQAHTQLELALSAQLACMVATAARQPVQQQQQQQQRVLHLCMLMAASLMPYCGTALANTIHLRPSCACTGSQDWFRLLLLTV